MKSKKLLIPAIIFAVTIVALVAYSVLSCIVLKPTVEKAEFPFSITYEYEGESKTVEGVYESRNYHCGVVSFEQLRYWEGGIQGKEEELARIIPVAKDAETEIIIVLNFDDGYLMGDPEYVNAYEEAGRDYAPYIMAYDAEGSQLLEEEGLLSAMGVSITEFDYPEPIENSFVFSHITHVTGDNVFLQLLISLAGLLLCIIFVKKEKELVYKSLDKLGMVFNIVLCVTLLPYVTIASALTDLNGDGKGFLCQLSYVNPAIFVLCIAASLCLRRKGYSKTSFIIQFGGFAWHLLVMVLGFAEMMILSI